MEQVTLQLRIEEKAKQRLLQDLKIATDKQGEIIALVGKENFPEILTFREQYHSYSTPRTKIAYVNDEANNKIFDSLLPKYIAFVTDELLNKIEQIDYFLSEKEAQEID